MNPVRRPSAKTSILKIGFVFVKGYLGALDVWVDDFDLGTGAIPLDVRLMADFSSAFWRGIMRRYSCGLCFSPLSWNSFCSKL